MVLEAEIAESLVQATNSLVSHIQVLVGGFFGLYLIYVAYMIFRKTRDTKILADIKKELVALNENFEEWRQSAMKERLKSPKETEKKRK